MFGMGLVLTCAASLGWVAADALRKRLASDIPAMQLAVWLSAGQLVILLLLTPVLLWQGELGGWSEWQLASAYWQYALPTFVCTSVGHVLFLRALRISDLGLTIPYLSFSPIFVMLFAILFLDEWPTTIALSGLLVVALGAFFLNPMRLRQDTQTSVNGGYKRGAAFMLGTAVFWSAAAAFDKAALQHASFLTHLVLLLGSTVVILGITQQFTVTNQASKVENTSAPALVMVCCTMLAALALQLAAYVYWDVAYVEAVKRALGLVGSVVAGTVFFKEGQPMQRLSSVVVMALGTALIILGG